MRLVRTMPVLAVVAVVAPVVGTASLAQAGKCSLGANVDFSIRHPEQGPNTTTFGWPGAIEFFQPGLRLGLQPGGGTSEVFLDTGVLAASNSGDNLSLIDATANYQYNFSSGARTRPYLAAGFGIIHQHASFGTTTNNASSGTGGAGLGVRHWLEGDRGSLRFEAHYDRIGRSKNNQITKAGVFSLRTGFDLWFR